MGRWVGWGGRVALLGALAAAFGGCEGPNEAQVPAVIVVPEGIELLQDQVLPVELEVQDQDGRALRGVALGFASSDGSVFSVTPDGVLTGEAGGEATLYVAAGPVSATVPVVVYGHPSGVRTERLHVTLRPYGAAVSRNGSWYVTRLDASTLVGGGIEAPVAVTDTVEVGWVPTAVAFAHDGATAYVTNQWSQSIGVVDVAARRQISTWAVPGDPFVVLPGSGGVVYVTLNTNVLAAVNASGGVTTTPVGEAPNGLALSPDGQRLYVSAAWSGRVDEIDTQSLQVLRSFAVGGMPQGVAVSRDGSELYVAASEFTIVDLTTGAVAATVPGAEVGFGMALSPDGARVYVTRHLHGEVVIVDAGSRLVAEWIDTGGSPRRVAVDRFGTTAIVANESGWVDFIR